MDFQPTKYTLQSCKTGRVFQDEGWSLADPQENVPSLIRAIYEKKQIDIKGSDAGLYKYADWLPIKKMLKGSCPPVTYKSEKLANFLGLENLYITFSGWWPQKGAFMSTCAFKETEAYSVCARLETKRILVVASAGNTARAFSKVCSDNNIPLVISIPEDNMNAMWFKEPLNPCVKIICTPKGSDYFDAIALAAKLNGDPHFIEEGGAKNVARRDGMGTTVLSAAEVIGRIPDLYFQAIGSGTGTIAAYEANLRLIEDGRWGKHLMRVIPSQNVPFTPMYDAWKRDSKDLLPMNEEEGRNLALQIVAKVLSNRKPPYSLAGGVYDCLKASKGDVEIADNEEILQACDLFEQLEGIDIHPAAGCALATLAKSVKKGIVKKGEIIMLNVTGGGEKLFKAENDFITASANLVLNPETPAGEVIEKVLALFKA